jgi:hypothetical protein
MDRRHTGRLRKRDSILGRGEEGVGEEPNHTTAEKLGPLYIIQYSLQIMINMMFLLDNLAFAAVSLKGNHIFF